MSKLRFDLTYNEKHEARYVLDAYSNAYDRAKEQGLTDAEARAVALHARDDAEAAYRGRVT